MLDSRVRGVFASPTTELLALTLQDNPSVQLRDTSTGSLIDTLPLTGVPYICAFSHDGQHLVVADYTSPAVSVWDIQTKQETLLPDRHKAPVLAIAFSPDGKLLATGGYDQVIGIWDARTYQHLKDLRGHGGAIFSLAFSPASDKIVSSSRDNTARVWDTSDYHLLHVLRGHSQAVDAAFFCDEGTTVVSCGDLTVRFWDLGQVESIRTIRREQRVRDVVFLDDHRFVYYEYNQSDVGLVDIDTMQQTRFCESGDRVYAIVACPSNRIAVGRADGKIELWDTDSRKLVCIIESKNKGQVYELQCDYSRGLLAAAMGGGFCVWRLGDDGEELLVSRPGYSTQSICFPGDGLLVWGNEDGELGFCNYQTDKILPSIPNAHRESITRIDYLPTKHLVVSCSLDGRVRLWDSRTFAPLGEIENTLGRQWWTSFSPDGRTLLTTGDDSYVTVWDLATRTQRFQSPKLAGAGKCLAISPSGKWLVASTLNGEIRIWDIGPSQQRH